MIAIIVILLLVIIAAIGFYLRNKNKNANNITDGTTDDTTGDTTDDKTYGATYDNTDGTADGTTDGTTDGTADGTTDGTTDGTVDGTKDSTKDGTKDSTKDGTKDSSAKKATQSPSNTQPRYVDTTKTTTQEVTETAVTTGATIIVDAALEAIIAQTKLTKEAANAARAASKAKALARAKQLGNMFKSQISKATKVVLKSMMKTKEVYSHLGKVAKTRNTLLALGKRMLQSAGELSKIATKLKNMYSVGKYAASYVINGGKAAVQALATTAQSVKAAAQGVIIAAKTAVSTATVSGTMASVGAAIYSNPAGIALLAFQAINMAIDAADPNGYNLLDKWNEVSAEVKAMTQETIDLLNEANTDGTPIVYPSAVGPIDIFTFMPSPSSKVIRSDDLANSEIKETFMDHALSNEIEILIADDDDPYKEPLNIQLGNLPDDSDFAANYTKIFSEFMADPKTLDYYMKKATENICIKYGGVMTGDGDNKVCSYKKEYCKDINLLPPDMIPILYDPKINEDIKENEKNDNALNAPYSSAPPYSSVVPYSSKIPYSSAPYYVIKEKFENTTLTAEEANPCQLIPDPNQDKCGIPDTPIKYVCKGGDILGPSHFDITKGWSEQRQQCISISPVIKAMCESNNMPYDIDKSICILSREMCLSKAGTPKELADGTIDCQIPMGQMIIEAIFGKTLTSTLIQTFADNQLEKCKPGYVVGGDPGLAKFCGADYEGGTEVAATVATTTVVGAGAATGAFGATAMGAAAAGGPIALAAAGLVVGTMAITCAAQKIASLKCRQKCKDDETDVAGICWPKNPKVGNPPCDAGYDFDGVTTCNAKNVFSELTFPIPNKCPNGYQLQGEGPLCLERHCDEGDLDVGLLCRRKCKDGFHDNGAGLCVNPDKPLLTIVPKEPCIKGYKFDDVSTCWMDPLTATRGGGIIPDNCPDKYDLVGVTCWSQCGKNTLEQGIIKDKGATCEICPPGLDNNGATLCYKPCDKNYNYDGTKMCNFNPVTVGDIGIPPTVCPDNYDLVYNPFPTCYSKCPAGSLDKGLFCETCPPGTNNTGASTCVEPCDTLYDVVVAGMCTQKPPFTGADALDVGIDPDYSCDVYNNKGNGTWDLEGIQCIRRPDGPYKRNPGDIVSYWLTQPVSKLIGVGIDANNCPAGYNLFRGLCYSTTCDSGYKYDGEMTCTRDDQQITSILPKYRCDDGYNYDGVLTCNQQTMDADIDCTTPCDGLSNVVKTNLNCSGWDSCASRTAWWCRNDCGGCVRTDWCASRTSDTCWWNCCGKNDWCRGGGQCVSKSWWDNCCTGSSNTCSGGDCIGGAKTRDCNITCPISGWTKSVTTCYAHFDKPTIPATPYCDPNRNKLSFDRCYIKPRDGYTYNIQDTPTFATPNAAMNSTHEGIRGKAFYTQTNTKKPTCNSNREFDDAQTFCYLKCDTGYHKNKGDIVTCWNDNPTSKFIPPENIKPATKLCRSNRDLIGSMCYLKCPKDYSRKGLSCVAPKGAEYTPKTYTLFNGVKSVAKKSQDAECKSNRTKDNSLCYLKCSDKDPKWSNVPGAALFCQGPRGLIYPTETATPKVNGKDSKPADCKSNRENDGGLCYKRCKDIFGDCYRTQPGAVTECMPKNGTSYNPNKAECPKGTVDNGAGMCANSYVPPTYSKKTITADCSGNRDQIAGSCYDKCPKIKDHDGKTDIQLKHLEGMPTQCVPSKEASYAGLVLSYIPDTYDRKRAIAYSTK